MKCQSDSRFKMYIIVAFTRDPFLLPLCIVIYLSTHIIQSCSLLFSNVISIFKGFLLTKKSINSQPLLISKSSSLAVFSLPFSNQLSIAIKSTSSFFIGILLNSFKLLNFSFFSAKGMKNCEERERDLRVGTKIKLYIQKYKYFTLWDCIEDVSACSVLLTMERFNRHLSFLRGTFSFFSL